MASPSSDDVLDEASTTLIAEVRHMQTSNNPQDIDKYIDKFQVLGRHTQLQEVRKWLNQQTGLPINFDLRTSTFNAEEYMSQDQIEQWINQWTTQHAKNKENKALRNFLRQEFNVQPNEKMKGCNGYDEQFMQFLLMSHVQHRPE